MKYTADDFKNARFATRPDGRFGARVDPSDGVLPWAVSEHDDDNGWRSDEAMLMGGWVPGLIVTETELAQATRKEGYSTVGPATRSVMAQFGLTVIPDPELTNAQKLKALCSGWTTGRNCLADEDLSDYLDRLGVKAPGGDDDR